MAAVEQPVVRRVDNQQRRHALESVGDAVAGGDLQVLVEAANIDGASTTRTLWSVIMPIARPAIAVTAIFAFLTGWGDFLFAETFTSNNNILPASITIYNLSGVAVETGQVVWPEVMAGSLILALPVLLAITVAQRYIRIGISAGAIKG